MSNERATCLVLIGYGLGLEKLAQSDLDKGPREQGGVHAGYEEGAGELLRCRTQSEQRL